MSGTGIREFIVGNTAYKYTELTPIDALSFGTRCAKTIGPILSALFNALGNTTSGERTTELMDALAPALDKVDDKKLEALLKECYSHVYTPGNECLGDEASFNSWFSERKHELFPVGITALIHLVKDFFPNLSDITKQS